MGHWFEWLITGLVVTIKGLLLYIWTKHSSELEQVSTSQSELKEKLMSNYYDRLQTERYVDKELKTVQQSIDHLAAVIIPLTDELRRLNDKVLILETKEQLNGKSRGSS